MTEFKDDDALPVRLPAAPAPKFSLPAIDYTISQHLQDLIPKEAKTATVSLRVTSKAGEDRILTGVVAVKTGKVWKLDLGAALGGSIDLDDHRNWQAEFLGVLSWK